MSLSSSNNELIDGHRPIRWGSGFSMPKQEIGTRTLENHDFSVRNRQSIMFLV